MTRPRSIVFIFFERVVQRNRDDYDDLKIYIEDDLLRKYVRKGVYRGRAKKKN